MMKTHRSGMTGLAVILVLVATSGYAQNFENDRFRQLDELLPTPNVYRTASGAPGHQYWQQRADYSIKVVIHFLTPVLTYWWS